MGKSMVKLPPAEPSLGAFKRSQVGKSIGSGVKGFGSGRPHPSTVNAVGGPVGKAPKAPGKSVAGFSGSNLIRGKV